MSTVPNVRNKSTKLNKTAGTIVNESVKNLNSDSNKHKKSVANDVDRKEMIATAAYYHAENRSFESGNEMQDWLEAEAEIDNLLQN